MRTCNAVKGANMRVAVIGAGAAGLAALRHLAHHPYKFTPVAYEMTPHVSGTWAYTDRIGTDDRGQPLHVSMYKNLRTNLPKEVMAFPDYAFSQDLPSFVSHEVVKKYLENYAAHFNLLKYIQFDTRVEKVSPVETSYGKHVWDVVISNVLQPQEPHVSHRFDAVIVCNGHYAVPLKPDLPGVESFQGTLLHSHDYRTPQPFAGKTVALLGAASSGQDMALDIAAEAKHVYLLHNYPALATVLPDNITQGCGISTIQGNTIYLKDKSEISVDALVYCTGYRYDFPFLSDESRLDITDERVTPLYKHIIHTKYPTLSAIGVCKKICPFPQFHCQVLFVIAALSGRMVLPSRENMEKDMENDFKWRTTEKEMPTRHAHIMGTLQWGYNDELAKLAGFKPIPCVIRSLYDYVHKIRVTNLPEYKSANYMLKNETEFSVVDS